MAGNTADGSFMCGWNYYDTSNSINQLYLTLLNQETSDDDSSSGGGGGGCFIESIGGGWQMLAGLLSGLLLIAGVRRR